VIKLLELLVDSKLFEMASSFKDARSILINRGPFIAEHILKLFLYPKSKNFNKWKGEVNGGLKSINRILLKPKNKRLDTNTLNKWLWETNLGTLEELKNLIIEFEEGDYKPSHHIDYNNLEELWKAIKALYININKDLSQGRFNDINNYLKWEKK
jgi:hypothetical protein